MSLTVAFQMDPIERVDIDADSTFALALEAQARGHRLVHYLPRHLSLRQGRLIASARPFSVRRERGRHVDLGPFSELDLEDQDVILLRQDPPFDMAYLSTTYLLEHVQDKVLVVNDPVSVRNAPEKLLVTFFSELTPPTLITLDPNEVVRFRAEHRDIIIKPLYGNGGAGVVRIRADDENLNAVLEMNEALFRTPYVVQAYLPAVRQGDKRIILIDGKAAGALNRRPKEGEARANLHVGGKSEACELTPRDREICEAIGPTLKERGLLFAGIDVIGDWLTEINVTSPTGIQEISRFTGRNLAGEVWNAIEARWRARN